MQSEYKTQNKTKKSTQVADLIMLDLQDHIVRGQHHEHSQVKKQKTKKQKNRVKIVSCFIFAEYSPRSRLL